MTEHHHTMLNTTPEDGATVAVRLNDPAALVEQIKTATAATPRNKLEALTGRTRVALYRAFNGTTSPNLDTFCAMADAAGFSIALVRPRKGTRPATRSAT